MKFFQIMSVLVSCGLVLSGKPVLAEDEFGQLPSLPDLSNIDQMYKKTLHRNEAALRNNDSKSGISQRMGQGMSLNQFTGQIGGAASSSGNSAGSGNNSGSDDGLPGNDLTPTGFTDLGNGYKVENGKIYDAQGNQVGTLVGGGAAGLDFDGSKYASGDPTGQGNISWQKNGHNRVDGGQTPYVALSNEQVREIRKTNPNFGLGQNVNITNTSNGKTISAVYADNAGNRGNLNHAEVSPAAATALGSNWSTGSKGQGNISGNYAIWR